MIEYKAQTGTEAPGFADHVGGQVDTKCPYAAPSQHGRGDAGPTPHVDDALVGPHQDQACERVDHGAIDRFVV
jgi:hypothetical protein